MAAETPSARLPPGSKMAVSAPHARRVTHFRRSARSSRSPLYGCNLLRRGGGNGPGVCLYVFGVLEGDGPGMRSRRIPYRYRSCGTGWLGGW